MGLAPTDWLNSRRSAINVSLPHTRAIAVAVTGVAVTRVAGVALVAVADRVARFDLG